MGQPPRLPTMRLKVASAMRAARLSQIRAHVVAGDRAPEIAASRGFFCAARSWYFVGKVLERLVGYRRTFGSMAEARAVAAAYLDASHECQANIARQIGHGLAARPSDYPVFWHLERIRPSSVFDLGGNVGNLFYCYAKYLRLPEDMVWTVQDLATVLRQGQELAAQRHESRLHFTDDLSQIANHEVLLVSGSLHYLEQPLPELLGTLSRRPVHVIINRVPIMYGQSVVTIQDAIDSLYACTIANASELIKDMEKIGYELVDSWAVPELSVLIPFFPDYSVQEYSGFYFRMSTLANGLMA